MKKLAFVAILSSISFFLFGQYEFKPGYITKLNGDTINGFIEIRNESINIKQCRFKPTMSAELTTYTPSELKAYRIIDERYYVSKLVWTETDSIFIEFLMEGKINLYKSINEQKEAFYIERSDLPLTYLPYNEVSIEGKLGNNNGAQYTRTSSQHLGILKYYTADYPELMANMDDLVLNEHNLLRLIAKYNKHFSVDGTSTNFIEKKSSANLDIELFGGFSSIVGYSQHAYPYGFMLHILPSRAGSNFSGKIGLATRVYSNEDETFAIINIPLLLEYRYKLPLVEPFGALGFNFMLTTLQAEAMPCFQFGTHIQAWSKIKIRAYYELNLFPLIPEFKLEGFDEAFLLGLYYTF